MAPTWYSKTSRIDATQCCNGACIFNSTIVGGGFPESRREGERRGDATLKSLLQIRCRYGSFSFCSITVCASSSTFAELWAITSLEKLSKSPHRFCINLDWFFGQVKPSDPMVFSPSSINYKKAKLPRPPITCHSATPWFFWKCFSGFQCFLLYMFAYTYV